MRASVYHDQEEIQNGLDMENEEDGDDEEEIYQVDNIGYTCSLKCMYPLQPNCHNITGGTCSDHLNCSCEPSNHTVSVH